MNSHAKLFWFKGIMKKNLQRWTSTKGDVKHRWNTLRKRIFCSLLSSCNAYLPTDIHRSIRKLSDLSHWKGSEYRTILLYVGIVVLRYTYTRHDRKTKKNVETPVLSTEEYENFLILSCASRIIHSSVYKCFLPIANDMFKAYVIGCIKIYGENTVGSNLHNLIHIVDDMSRNNIENVNELSTYKFENHLNLLGQKLKGFHRPLEQISRRILEFASLNSNIKEDVFNPEREIVPVLKYEIPPNTKTYSTITLKNVVTLSAKKIGDQWFMSHSGSIVKMKHATEINGIYTVHGYRLLRRESFFTTPMDSAYLSIFQSDGKTTEELIEFNTDDISAKMICLKFGAEFVYMPLLHTLDIFSN